MQNREIIISNNKDIMNFLNPSKKTNLVIISAMNRIVLSTLYSLSIKKKIYQQVKLSKIIYGLIIFDGLIWQLRNGCKCSLDTQNLKISLTFFTRNGFCLL